MRSGVPPRDDAECVYCGSLERQRLIWFFMSRKTDLSHRVPMKMLHVAPEPCLEPRLKEKLGENYLTADLSDPRAMLQMDITDIPYADQSFDAILCSHVLEHVQDDIRAMREFHRVLNDDGWAILLVPITRDKTFEDPSITEPRERLEVYGQEDHIRRYGWDYVDRLREAGFSVEITEVRDLVPADEAIRMGITPTSRKIFYCTK